MFYQLFILILKNQAMPEFIVAQAILEKQEGNNVWLGLILRRVIAEKKEEAIGKFVLNTQDIKAHKKMDIECYEFSKNLRTIE